MSIAGHGEILKAPRTLRGPAFAIDVRTRFDYLFGRDIDLNDPANFLPAADSRETTQNLIALGRTMAETASPDENNARIPAIYTYLGQFIDHDITLQSRDDETNDINPDDTVPIAPSRLVGRHGLRFNKRNLILDLDSVYGDGPLDPATQFRPEAADFYKPDFSFKLSDVTVADGIPGDRIPPEDDLERDLFRDENGKARIGDPRNDENLVVAQLHVAFLRFHNAALEWVKSTTGKKGIEAFNATRKLVRSHYQWLVLHDYLKTVALPEVIDDVVRNGPYFYPTDKSELFMPCEFADAAFRFGHSMVRNGYDLNRNFGQEAVVQPFASLEQLFRFTGGGGFQPGGPRSPGEPATPTLPFNWIVEWDRFTDRSEESRRRKARKFDTRLASSLLNMFNEGEDAGFTAGFKEMAKHLAMRNLLRGYLFSTPTAQAMIGALQGKGICVEPLSEEELRKNNSPETNELMKRAGFLQRTPAWFYVLKEAEVRENGERLGTLGSYILAETFVGLLRCDDTSILNEGWEPSRGVKDSAGNEVRRIEDFLKFAGVMVPEAVPA